MRIGIFDSGIGGLTVLSDICKVLKGSEIFYIADTLFAPYGEKSQDDILSHSKDVSNYLIDEHKIDLLIIACNTATSAAVKYLREEFPSLLIIGAEPGIKPAFEITKTNNIGILATPATLEGKKYKLLLQNLKNENKINVFECACYGLVEQIENNQINSQTTYDMLSTWLEPMKKNSVDVIVLGCTHYPLIKNIIKKIMGNNIKLIETGPALAQRLISLSQKKAHINEGLLKVFIYSTNKINIELVNHILDDYEYLGIINIKRKKINGRSK